MITKKVPVALLVPSLGVYKARAISADLKTYFFDAVQRCWVEDKKKNRLRTFQISANHPDKKVVRGRITIEVAE